MRLRSLHCFFLLVLTLLACGSARAQNEAIRLQRAYERIDDFVARHRKEAGTPGLALALTSREGVLRVATYGFADLKARVPVTPETLFEIGSISKSFTAIALLQLREEGRFDPHKPLTTYLPWFEIQTEYEPLTPHHLLTHTAGLPRDRDDIPTSVYSALALRERATGYAPALRFAYSNIGYQVLGILLEVLEERPYAESIRRRIFEPLGMTASEPAITHDIHSRLAVGYERLYDDQPSHSSHPLVEATWFEYGAGDGSIAATPADLAAYLRMLLNRGAGPHGRVLSEESFELLIQPGVKTDDNEHYGYGISVTEKDGRTLIGHSGGMVGYSARLLGDLDEGLGVVVFVNGPGSPGRVAEFALEALQAAMHEQALPPLPDRKPATRVENAADYAGTYSSPDGKSLTLRAEGEKLLLPWGEETIALERRGKDRFFINHPHFALFLLRFGRDQEEKIVEATYGPDWYWNGRYHGPRQFRTPAAWNAYPGHYRTPNPWFSNFRIVLRKGKLWLVAPGGDERELVELEPGFFQVGTEETAERLRLDAVVNGKALRSNFSGVHFYRTFTP